jgi:hypothetical protein
MILTRYVLENLAARLAHRNRHRMVSGPHPDRAADGELRVLLHRAHGGDRGG